MVFEKSVIVVGMQPSSFAELSVYVLIILFFGQPPRGLYQVVVASISPPSQLCERKNGMSDRAPEFLRRLQSLPVREFHLRYG